MLRERNSMEICVFGLLAASSAKTAFFLQPLPGSLASSAFGRFAATTLFAGCVAAIVGLLWRDRRDGLLVEQFGCALTCFGLVFYGSAVLRANPYTQSAYVVGMSYGIAAFCAFRYWQIDRYVRAKKRARLDEGRTEGEPR